MRVEAAVTRLLHEPAGAARLQRIGLTRESRPWWGRYISGPERGWEVALRYFSLDAGFTGDPMLDHLARRMGATIEKAVLVVIRLHETAARWSDETGCLGLFTAEALAREIGWNGALDDMFPALISFGFLDKKLTIPGWKERYRRLLDDRKSKKEQREAARRQSADSRQTVGRQSAPISEVKGSKEQLPPTPSVEGVSLTTVMSAWNAATNGTQLPACRVASPERRRHLGARLAESALRGLPAWWEAYLAALVARPWCRGENDRGWVADLDYALKAKTCTDYEEGKWNHHPPALDLTK